MKKSVSKYLDDVFGAIAIPSIAFGPFLERLKACVEADGGSYNDLHRYFELPPKVTGGAWEVISECEIFEQWWK